MRVKGGDRVFQTGDGNGKGRRSDARVLQDLAPRPGAGRELPPLGLAVSRSPPGGGGRIWVWGYDAPQPVEVLWAGLRQ